jgi:hypothetical protein
MWFFIFSLFDDFVKGQRPDDKVKRFRFNPEFAVAIYYGLKILAATLVYCFYHPVLLTGPQRETSGTFVPLLFHPLDETILPVARVVVCDTILLLNIIMIMPASQNRSNCAFRCSFLRLVTKPTAKSGFNVDAFVKSQATLIQLAFLP